MLNVWTSYHLPEIKEEYNLKENDGIRLFCTTESLGCDNINMLNKYYCELCTMYYVWKNNIKSDYIGFQHYRYLLTYTDLSPITNNGYDIICENAWLDNYYLKLKQCGINDYIIIKCIDFINELTGINKITLYDMLYKDNFEIFCGNTFICSWEIFNELCIFIFGLLDYLIPGGWYNENNVIDSIDIYKNMFYQSNNFYHIENDDKCDYGWGIKVNNGNRLYIFLFEWLIPFYLKVRNYKFFNILSNIRHYQYKYIITDAQKIDMYDIFMKYYKMNIFTGVRNICIYNYHGGIIEYLLNDMGNDIFNYCFKYVKLFEDLNEIQNYIKSQYVKNENIYMCNINEYIDVNSPFDFYKNDKYMFTKI